MERESESYLLSFGALVLVRRWYGRSAYLVLGFGIAWTLACVFAIAKTERVSVVGFLVSLLPVTLGLFITYAGICRVVNRTEIALDPQALRVRHLPLPWPKASTLPLGDVERIECKKRRGEDHAVMGYELWAQLRGGKRVRLMGEVGDEDQVAFVGERIERYLRRYRRSGVR